MQIKMWSIPVNYERSEIHLNAYNVLFNCHSCNENVAPEVGGESHQEDGQQLVHIDPLSCNQLLHDVSDHRRQPRNRHLVTHTKHSETQLQAITPANPQGQGSGVRGHGRRTVRPAPGCPPPPSPFLRWCRHTSSCGCPESRAWPRSAEEEGRRESAQKHALHQRLVFRWIQECSSSFWLNWKSLVPFVCFLLWAPWTLGVIHANIHRHTHMHPPWAGCWSSWQLSCQATGRRRTWSSGH